MIYRVGALVRPLYKFYRFRDLGAIIKFSYYRKMESGVISDTKATETDQKSVGTAVDLNLVYKVDTHINFFYGTGIFFPGAAYPKTITITNSKGKEETFAVGLGCGRSVVQRDGLSPEALLGLPQPLELF